MTIVELREKRAKLWATMEGFLDTHRDRKGVLSAEDDAVYANMEKELNDLTNEVRRMERRDAIAAELDKPVSSPITEQPQKATGEAKTGRASNAYREDFGLHLRGKRMLHNVLSEGVDANGGYLVTLKNGDELFCNYLLAAPGRSGAEWFSDVCKNLGLHLLNNQVDVGVRVELPATVFEHITNVVYESKLIYRTKQYGDQVRTFCMNPY